ncbi:hypothetical protein GCM10010250_21240 [Streptomyces althioticus]|uniref:hypothetical protein n=1 Tax=Streptomyces althioticus TaxID=83380 RepID=UPI00187676D8|nr:hypothetical protein GCM10010250_21240 [Streptomyces althioticus]
MNEHLSGEAAAAAALAHLLADHPDLGALVWSIGQTPGVLAGHQMAESGQGEIVDACSAVMGGTVARSTHALNGDGHGLAQLSTFFDGVPVQVWVSYPLADRNGLHSAELAALLSGRQLGTLPLLPGGAQ